MTSRFRPTAFTRFGNQLVTNLIRLGLPMGGMALLTVPGRRSGQPRTTPVVVGDHGGERWVLSPYGEVDWVRNLRTAGSATLTRRGRTQPVRATELDPESAAPLLRQTLATAPGFTRKQFAVTADSTPDDLRRAVADHPVFRLE